MGLFDSVAGQVLGSFGGGRGGLVDMVTNLIATQPGGLSGLVSTFESHGLGPLVASWIGSGHNLPVSAEQVKTVLGDQRIQAIAAKVGLSADTIASHLATLM